MKLLWIQLALGLFQADMAVKQEIESRPEFEKEQTFLNGRIRVKKLHNHGAAGGGFTDHMGTLIRVSGIMTLGSIGAFLHLLFQEGRTMEKAGLAFLVGGALSNLYDRCRRGYVVDYVSFRTPWKKLSRLVFNLADFWIFIGTFFICLGQAGRTRR